VGILLHLMVTFQCAGMFFSRTAKFKIGCHFDPLILRGQAPRSEGSNLTLAEKAENSSSSGSVRFLPAVEMTLLYLAQIKLCISTGMFFEFSRRRHFSGESLAVNPVRVVQWDYEQ